MNVALFNAFMSNLANSVLNSNISSDTLIAESIKKTEGMSQDILNSWMNDSTFSKLYIKKLVDTLKIKSVPKLLSDALRNDKKSLDAIKFLTDSKNVFEMSPSEKSFSVGVLDYLKSCQSLIIHPDDANLKQFEEEEAKYKASLDEYLKERLSNISDKIGGYKHD